MTRPRLGMLLPAVMIIMVVVLIVSVGAQLSAWRAARGAQLQWDAERALHEADASVAEAMGQWSAARAANTVIGVSAIDSTNDHDWIIRRDLRRTAPLVAVIHASVARSMSTATLGDAHRTRRDVTRIVRLAPPEFGVVAASTTLGPLAINDASVDGRDLGILLAHPFDDCGRIRDTASVDAIRGQTVAAGTMAHVHGDVIAMSSTDVVAARSRFDRAWDVMLQRVASATDSGRYREDPLAWHVRVMPRAMAETLHTNTRVVGVLAIDGDFVVRSALHVDGLLVVRGALDASSGALAVDGAVIVRDYASRGSTFGATMTVRYAPCLVGRALSTVARPELAPFASWQSR